jgi:hypothetical protein
MIKPTTEILKEAIDGLNDTIDYVLSESGDINISRWLMDVETKLAVVYGRLVNTITQQKGEYDESHT